MFPIFNILVTALLLPSGLCFFVEINLNDKNESRNIKLLCGPAAEKFNVKDKHSVLWQGSHFGSDEQKKLSEKLLVDVLVPNITINSSNRHTCYILADDTALEKLTPTKKRTLRDSSASIPAENGVCPPGYRIDQDRCYPCFPGSYTSGQDTECFLCPKDFYIDKKGADACWPCPDGRKTLAQGADSAEACVYFDDAGHAVTTQSPPWILMYTLIAIIIICVWIIIIILTLRYWKEWKRGDSSQVESFERRVSSTADKTTDIEDPIYAEIGDYDDTSNYEIPKKPSDEPVYLDLEAPTLPPKRHRKSMKGTRKSSSSEHQYEIPNNKTSNAEYETPIRRRSTEEHSPTKKVSESQYEVPIQRGSDHQYTEILSDPEEHIYDTIQDVSDEHKNISFLNFRNSKNLPKTHSIGFKPTTRLATTRKVESESKSPIGNEAWKVSSENRKQSVKISKDKMLNIPEGSYRPS